MNDVEPKQEVAGYKMGVDGAIGCRNQLLMRLLTQQYELFKFIGEVIVWLPSF